MPYIKNNRRHLLEPVILDPQNAGELNYCITRLIVKYVIKHGLNYETMSSITGVLQDVQDEFHNRIYHLYEHIKCHENGDVYTELLNEIQKYKNTHLEEFI